MLTQDLRSALITRASVIAFSVSMTACGAAAQSPDVTYTYDALGRLKVASYANGNSVTYSYDAAGNRTQVAAGAVNLPPTTVNDAYQQSPGTTVDHDVLANDTDPENDPLTIASETGSTASIANNKIRFVAPAPSGSYAFDYVASDGQADSHPATVTITVPNVSPNTTGDSYTQTHGTTVDHNVLSNDTDANGDSLTLTGENRSYSSIVGNKLRVAAPNASGSYVITYNVSDGNGGTASALATINVPNVAPNAVNNTYTQTHGTTVNHNVLGNDSDPNGDSLTLTSENGSYSSISSNKLRVVAPNASGSYVITYGISDGKGGSDTATATINVPNVAPVAAPDSENVPVGGSDYLAVLLNDSDPNGDSLTITHTTQGYVVLGGTAILFEPTIPGFHNFTYTISDGKGGSDSSSVTVYATGGSGGGGGGPLPF